MPDALDICGAQGQADHAPPVREAGQNREAGRAHARGAQVRTHRQVVQVPLAPRGAHYLARRVALCLGRQGRQVQHLRLAAGSGRLTTLGALLP